VTQDAALESRPEPVRRVRDADVARARRTEQLLGSLAGALGLSVDSIRVHVDDEAAARTRSRGARGLMQDGVVWLDPRRYDPRAADGRALLAHETTHLAQRAEVRLRPDRDTPSLRAAEKEAAAVAAAVSEGRPVPRLRATLPAGAAAMQNALADAATLTTPPEHSPPPAPRRDPVADFRQWRQELIPLAQDVPDLYPSQLALMREHVDRTFWVTDSDVDRVMEALAPLRIEDAAALVHALGASLRVRLIDNISASHKRSFRREVLASYAGLATGEVSPFGADLFADLSPAEMTPDERFLAIVTLLAMSPAAQRALLNDSDAHRAEGFRSLVSDRVPDPAGALDTIRRRAQQAHVRAWAERGLTEAPQFVQQLARLRELLRRPTGRQAVDALQLLGGLRPAAAAAAPERAAADAPGQRPATQSAGERQPPPAPPPREFSLLVERLEQDGSIERLLRHLPSRSTLSPVQQETFTAVLRERPVDANERLLVALLDQGWFIFRWSPSAEEKRLAWEIVRALPLDARDRFLRRDGGEWLQRLGENLPPDLDPSFVGLAVRRDEYGALVDEGALQAARLGRDGTAHVNAIRQTLALGTRQANARALAQIAAVEPPELREAVVGWLDTRRLIDPLLEGLPDDVLFSEDRRLDLMKLAAARDTQQLFRHVQRLTATGFFNWVTSREAFIAFQLVRALPQAERLRLGQLDFIVGELSANMRASAGMHVLDARSAVAQYDATLQRLRDERLWTPARAAELRSLLGVAVAIGGRRELFELSRARWTPPRWPAELAPVIARYELYDERAGRTEYRPQHAQEAETWDDVGALSVIKVIASSVWIVLRDTARGLFYVDPFRERLGHRRFQLAEAQSMLGNDIAGVRFRDPSATQSQPERAALTAQQGGGREQLGMNEVSISFDQRSGRLVVDLPALEIDSIGLVSEGWSFHTGTVSGRGLHVEATFQTDDLTHPRTADLTMTDLTLNDVLAGGTSSLNSAARIHLSTLGVHGSTGREPPRPPTSTLVPVPILGPIFELVRMLYETYVMAKHGGHQLARSIPELRGVQVDIDSFEIEGLNIGGRDIQVASLAVAGVHLAWGGTRTQYLRMLIAALDRRIAAARDATELASLRQQQTTARQELADREPRERDMLRLVREAQSDPSRSNPQRILELQDGARGGVVIDTGQITLHGVAGAVSIADASIERLRGQGTSEALTAGILTDDALLRLFTHQGPPTGPDAAPLDRSAIELEAGTVHASDIAVEAAIPPTSALQRELEQLQAERTALAAGDHDVMRQRLETRIHLVERRITDRSELDRLEALGQNAPPAQAQRRRELHTQLAREFGLTVASAGLTDVHISSDLEGGRTSVNAAMLDVARVESDAFAVQSVHAENVRGTAHVLPGLSGLTDIQAIEGPRTADGKPTPGLQAGRLQMQVVRLGQLGSTLSSVDVTGLSGSAEPVPGGWRLRGVHIDSLTLERFDWGTRDKRIYSNRTVVVSGLDADVTYTTSGEGARAVTQIDVNSLEIKQVTVGGLSSARASGAPDQTPRPQQVPARDDGLIYEDYGPRRLRVQILGGGLRGIFAERVRVAISAATTEIGRIDTPAPADGRPARESHAGIRHFDALRFSGALGEHLSAGGRLSSGTRDAFEVHFASDGATDWDLRGLELGDATVGLGAGRSVRIERLDLTAHAHVRTSGEAIDIDVTSLSVPDAVLGRIDWRTDDGAVIAARGTTELQDVSARLDVGLVSGDLANLLVRHLHIGRITAEDLDYSSGTLDVHIRRTAPGQPPPLVIENVVIDGLHYAPGQGITAGMLGVTSAAAAGQVKVAPDTSGGTGTTVLGSLRARSISVSFMPGDRLTARAQHVDADAEIAAGTTTTALSLTDLDTGGIEVSPTKIRIGAGSQPHLRLGALGRIHVPRLHFEGDAFSVDVVGGAFDLTGLDAALTIDLNPPRTTPRIQRVTIDELNLSQLRGTGFRISSGRTARWGSIDFTRVGNQARLEGARVRDLAFNNSSSGWALAGYSTMHLDALELDQMHLDLDIAAIRALSASTVPAPPAPPFSRYQDVLNSLDGNVDFDLTLPIWLMRGGRRAYDLSRIQPVFTVRVAIAAGRIDVTRVEHGALGGAFDEVIDFEQRGSTLVLEFDPRRAAAGLGAVAGELIPGVGPIVGGGVGGAVGSHYRKDIAYWHLSTGETETSVNVYTLTQATGPPPAPGPSPVEFDLPRLRVRVLPTTRLDLVNTVPLTVPVGSLGDVTLAPQALRDLTLRGEIPGSIGINVGMRELSVQSARFALGAFGSLNAGALVVRGVSDGHLAFGPPSFATPPATPNPVGEPIRFTGNVAQLRWEQLDLTGTPAPPLATPAPVGPAAPTAAGGRRTP
jgi:hypothetical protein